MPGLSRSESRIIVDAARRLGVDLQYFRQPEPDTVAWLLRRCLDEALAGAAIAQSAAERQAWNRAIVHCRIALDSGRGN